MKRDKYLLNGLFVIGLVILICALILGIGNTFNRGSKAAKTSSAVPASNSYSDYWSLFTKAQDYDDRGNYDEALKLLKQCEKTAKTDPRIYREEGYAYFQKGEYENSLQEYHKALDINGSDAETRTWCAYDEYYLNDIDDAIAACNAVIDKNADYAFAYSVRGLALYSYGDEEGALESLDKAIAIKPDDEDYYDNKAYVLYELKRYTKCIETCKFAEGKFPKNLDFYYYSAESSTAVGKNSDAINEYKKIIKIAPKDDYALEYLAEQYYYMEDYDASLQYADKALAVNPSNSYALELKSEIDEAKKPEAVRVVDFVRENYLYIDKVKNFDEKAKEFEKKQNISSADVKSFIESIKLKDDPYTYVIDGQYYDYYSAEDETPEVTYKEINSSTCLIGIKSFSSNVQDAFANMLDNIKDSKDKNLILDLRGNGGGSIDAANDILDMLLPECTPSYLVSRNGSISDFKSDACSIRFKNIAVLVDEESASSSELLTLGLKKYLSNVVIIGHPTVGKGVGQKTFESKKNRYFLYLVSFYWNVREKNIAGDRIHPDILVKGSKDSDYIDEALKSFK